MNTVLKRFVPGICRPNISTALTLAGIAILIAILQLLVDKTFPNQYQSYEDFLKRNNLNFVTSMIVASAVIGILGILCAFAVRKLGDLILLGILGAFAVAVAIMIAVTIFINPDGFFGRRSNNNE